MGGWLWNLAYLGRAPWDIGRPRPELVRLVESGEVERLFSEEFEIDCLKPWSPDRTRTKAPHLEASAVSRTIHAHYVPG